MAAILQLRRGSGSIDLSEGELYLNNGVGSIQFGSGSSSTASVIEYTLLPLNAPVAGNINLIGNITASNILLSGDAKINGNINIGGNIVLGTGSNDIITVNAPFIGSLIPQFNGTDDLGASDYKWKNLYAVSASIDSILVPGSGILSSSGISFDLYTGSVDTKNSTLATYTQSVDADLTELFATASNHEGRVDLLEAAMSGSNRLYVSPQGTDTTGSVPHGTEHNPYKTIKAAVESLYTNGVLNTSIQKRYTIFVGSGNYTEQNPIVVPPGVAIVGDNLRTVRLTASSPTKDYFHCYEGNYFYGLRFLNLQNPSFCFSFPCSTATGSISAGGVSSIGVVHSMTGYTDGNNQDLGIIIEGPDASGSIATATANVVGGVITQINVVSGGTNYTTTEKPYISIPAPLTKRPIIGTSPYIQNCSSITGPFTTDGTLLSLIPENTNNAPLPYNVNDVRNASNAVIGSGVIDEQGAGGGIRIDGNLVHPSSPLESMVADAFTQVNQGGPGHLVINKGYAQFVSCFTTFCTYGFKTANGGFANVSNSVIDFGKEGLISKTYFPQTYNSGSSLQTLTSTVVGAVIDQDGAGYTGSVATVTISGGGGSGATAEATINANGSVNEIVILTPGSGYTSQPNLTIAAPTGAGAIQATTVAGKANISGIAAILFQLESGSRGVDVSSNMILSGTDYLVTNVTTGSSANERYVTVYPAPPSIATGDNVYFHQLSNISTGGLVLEYVGSGVTYNALPKFGGVPNRTKEIIEYAPGRVFYSTVDNIGNLKIGDFFEVNQLTGEVSITAESFNLTGLNTIGPFKRNGVAAGVVLQEVSNNTTLLNSQGLYGEDTVPTQYAVKEYISIISSSLDGRLDKLEIASASLNTFSSSALIRLSNLETTSGSSNIRLNNLESKSASVDISIIEINSYTGSQNTKNSTLGTYTSSLDTKNSTLGLITSSLLAFTASEETKNSTLATYTGSVDTKWETLLNVTASVLSYTQSLKDAITVSGSDASSTTTIKGNLVVQGTQTSINSTAIVLGDNIIELNGTGVANGGLLVKDPTGANTISGSLLWDSTEDYWKAGAAGAESKLLRATGDSVVSGSSQIDLTLTTNYVSGIKTRLNVEGVISSSIQINLNDVTNFSTYSQSVDDRIKSLNSYTSSQDTKNTTLGTYSGSINDKWSTIQNVTASLINATSSYETTGRGIVSGSSQILSLLPTGVVSGSSQVIYSDISSIPVGIVSGSTQVTPLLPIGTISGSSQVEYTSLSSIPAGIVSGSQQLTSSYDGRYAPSASFATLLGANTLASLGSAAFYHVSSSIVDGNPNTLGNAFAIKQYIDDTLIAVGAGDITGVFSGNGLSGSANSGSATLTLDTGSTHFTNGVDTRLIPLTSLNSYTGSQDTKNSNLATYTASIDSHISNLNQATSSYETNGRGIVSGSSQVTPLLPTGTVSGSSQIFGGSGLVSGSEQINIYNVENYATFNDAIQGDIGEKLFTSSFNEYTASASGRLNNIEAATSSYETNGRGIVSGSSQLSGTTITDLTIINLTTINETASVIFSSGSNRFGDFGNDTHSFTGSVQITGSLTTIGESTATSFNGVINATNGVISGSSQITSVGTLTSLNVSPGAITGSSTGNIIPFYFANQAAFPSATTYHGAIAHSHTDGKMYFAHGGAWNELANANGNISGSSQVSKTLQEVTTAGNTTSTSISITNSTASTSKTTGALIVTGGIGTSGDINAGGDIVAFASSDSRLKNNIRPIQSPLEKISKINGCEFEWNTDLQSIYSGKDYGVIAQEIEEVFPELVQTRENGYKAVKYDKLVSVLIEGIKELTKQVEYLKTKIEN